MADPIAAPTAHRFTINMLLKAAVREKAIVSAQNPVLLDVYNLPMPAVAVLKPRPTAMSSRMR